MRVISYKLKTAKSKVIMILVCSALILTNFSFIKAEQVSCVIGTGTEVYPYQQLMNLYEINSTSYARNIITYQIEAMNGMVTTASLSQANEADAKLQNDISSFSTIYQQVLTTEAQNVLKNNFLKLELDLIINKKKTDYLKANGKYLDLLYKVENIKYQHGLSTKSNVDKINVEILKNSNSLSMQEYVYSENRNAIKKETKITDNVAVRYDFSLYEKIYNADQIMQNFIQNNTKYLQLRHLESCYQNYLNENNNLNALISGQVQYIISDYNLQAEELKEEISVYVKSAINSYQSAFRNMVVLKAELQLLNDNYWIEQVKLNNKKGTEVALSLAYAEKEAGEIAFYQSCIEFIMWENIIENGIYVN